MLSALSGNAISGSITVLEASVIHERAERLEFLNLDSSEVSKDFHFFFFYIRFVGDYFTVQVSR